MSNFYSFYEEALETDLADIHKEKCMTFLDRHLCFIIAVDCPDHLEVTLKGTVLEYHKSRAGNFTQSYDGTYWANQHGNAIWYYRNQWRIGYLEDLYTTTEGIHSRSIEANLCPNSETIQWKYAAHDGTFNDADDNVLVREVQAGRCDFYTYSYMVIILFYERYCKSTVKVL